MMRGVLIAVETFEIVVAQWFGLWSCVRSVFGADSARCIASIDVWPAPQEHHAEEEVCSGDVREGASAT